MIEINEKAYMEQYHASVKALALTKGVISDEEFVLRYKKGDDPGLQEQALSALSEDTLVVFVIGIGNGKIIKHLRAGLDDRIKMIIWEPIERNFLLSCFMDDFSDLICDENTDIVVGWDEDAKEKLAEVIKSRVDTYNIYHCAILQAYGFGDIYQKYESEFNEIFENATFYMRVDIGTREFFAQQSCRNELKALSLLEQNAVIDGLLTCIPTREIPVIIVAAGPSLEKNVSLLKELGKKALIVAVARVSAFLQKRGIPMHLVTMVDGCTEDKVMSFDVKRKLKMLMAPVATGSIQESYSGNIIY
nr:DUF115 domain-containing protein [Lachnospiraceae bacterium]